MAYMDMFNMGGFNPMAAMNMFGGPGETEEERRRREEQELFRQQEAQRQRDLLNQQRQQEQMMVAGPVAPALAPQLGQTESEVTPGYQPQPFKQTLITDPVTGQQKLKMEGAPQDFTSANPYTPTIAGPMAPGGMTGPTPEEIMRDQEQRRQYEIMMAQPQAMAAPAVTGPAEPTMLARAPTTTMTDVTAGTTGPIVPPGQAINPETGELYTPVPAAGPAPSAAPAAGGGAVLPVSTTVTAPAPSPADVAQRQMMAQDIQEGPVVRQAIAEGAGPMAMNWFNVVQAAQNDPAAMERIARDPNTPEQWRRVAASQARLTLDDQRKMEQAEAKAKKIIAEGGRGFERELRKPTETGSYLKAYLFRQLGLDDLARAEQAKLSSSWQIVSDDTGNRALVRMRGDGLPIEGIGADNQPIAPDQLMAFAGGGAGKVKPDVSTQDVEATIDGKGIKGRVVTTYDAQNRPKTQVESGGRFYAYTNAWKPVRISTAAEMAVAQKEINLAYDPIIAAAKSGAEFLGKFNAEHGTSFAIRGYDTNRNPIVIDQNTNQVIAKSPTGVVTATTSRATAPRGTTPADIVSGREIQQTTSKEFIKINADNANKQADKASGAPALLTAVDNIIRQTQDNPQFFNAMQTPAYRAFAAAQGPEAAARLKELSDAVRIPERDRPRFNQLMNDIKRLELAGITSSGLTASQLNTERESQRVVNAFAVNTSDSPQAARIQAEIARATIEYQRQFARFLGNADPTQNPARIRNDFDEKIGDKIWSDLMPKLEAIQRGGVVDFRSKQ